MVRFHEIPNSAWFHLPDRYVQQGYRLNTKEGGSSGEHGIVKKFDCTGLPSIVVKKFRVQCRPTMVTKEGAQLLLRELNLLRSMRHPNIVRLVDKYSVNDHTATPSQVPETMGAIYHITPYCGLPLTDVIVLGNHNMDQVKTWTRELLSALQYIHSLGISHRDLHPGSMCIGTEDGRKLTLLGFSKARVLDHENNTQGRGKDFYSAIEMQIKMKKSYDEMVDIWSLAVILCEMISGKVLFTGKDGSKDTVKNVLKPMIEYCGPVEESVLARVESDIDRKGIADLQNGAIRKDFQEFLRADVKSGRGISAQDIDNEPHLRNFIDRTLQHNPKARMSADEALCHRFVFPRELPKETKLPTAEDAALKALMENIYNEIHAEEKD